MTVVNLDNNIVFGTLRPPPLRLLVFVGDKNVRDVNWLRVGKIMIKLARWWNIQSPRPKDPESGELSLAPSSCLFSFSFSSHFPMSQTQMVPEPTDQHIQERKY